MAILLSIQSQILSFLIGLISIFLYSFLIAVVLLPVYGFATVLFSHIEKYYKHWMFDAVVTAFILSFVVVVFLYFTPYLFLGWEFNSFKFLETTSQWVWMIVKVLFNLIYVAAIVALIAILFAVIFCAFEKKFSKQNYFVKIYLSLYAVSFLLLLVNMLFPWILGGIILMIYF